MTKLDAYPHGPGWQGTATSKEAAEAIAHRLGRLHRVTIAALLDGPKTVDEVTQWAKGWIRTYSARLSELRALGLVEPSGERRPSAAGRPSVVWRVIPERIPPAIDPRITPIPGDGHQ